MDFRIPYYFHPNANSLANLVPSVLIWSSLQFWYCYVAAFPKQDLSYRVEDSDQHLNYSPTESNKSELILRLGPRLARLIPSGKILHDLSTACSYDFPSRFEKSGRHRCGDCPSGLQWSLLHFFSACKEKQHVLWLADHSHTYLCIWNSFSHYPCLDKFLLSLRQGMEW